MNIFEKIKNGFAKTKEELKNNIDGIIKNFKKIDEEFFDELEETLIMSDIGVNTTMDIMDSIRQKVKEEKIIDTEEVKKILKQEIKSIMIDEEKSEETFPKIVLVMGINGVGKTTTIGKLAYNYKNNGKKVLLVAADTFRAAAIEQLDVWAKRVNVDIIKHEDGADPGAVVYDGIAAAKARKADVVLCDTAGRLHNKVNLMNELEKITKIAKENAQNFKFEILLVLDANTGQNAIEQAKKFSEIAKIDGIALTKIDSSAKGGIVIAIKKELNIPIKYVGVGEGIDDLEEFNAEAFINGILD